MQEHLSILAAWTPWHSLAAVGMAVAWLLEWSYVASEAGAARRAEFLRGNILENYRLSLRDRLDGFARFIGDAYQDGPRDFSAVSFWAVAGWVTIAPFVILAIGWSILDLSGRIGALAVFPDTALPWQRWVTLAGLAAALFGPHVALARFRNSRLSELVAIAFAGAGALAFYYSGALVVAFVVAGAAAFAGAGGGAIVLAGAYAIVFAKFGALAGVIGFAAAFATAFAGFYLSDLADDQKRGWIGALAFAAALLAVPLFLSWFEPRVFGEVFDVSVRPTGAMVGFLMLLPAINAPFVWLSLGLSRFFARQMATAETGIGSIFDNRFVGWLLEPVVVLLNLALALILAAGLVLFAAFFAPLFGELHVAPGETGFDEFLAFIEAVRADPADPKHYWFYAMMLWTVVPALLYAVLFLSSFVISALSVLRLSNLLALTLELLPAWARALPALVFVALRFGPALYLGFELVRWTPWLLSQANLNIADISGGLADAALNAARIAAELARAVGGA